LLSRLYRVTGKHHVSRVYNVVVAAAAAADDDDAVVTIEY